MIYNILAFLPVEMHGANLILLDDHYLLCVPFEIGILPVVIAIADGKQQKAHFLKITFPVVSKVPA